MPPAASGIAAYSAELVPALRRRGHAVDVFTESTHAAPPDTFDLREFVWMERRNPYALTVYQLGNHRCHDDVWGYLFRFPGLVVLHDAQVHQARARALLERWEPRRADYLAEFAANHPDAPPDLGLLFEAGLGGGLYAHWPLVRLVLQSARLAAVHSAGLARRLAESHDVDVDTVPMGVPDPVGPSTAADAVQVRERHGIPRDAIVVGAFGGVTPEKRIPELLTAVAALVTRVPALHVLIVGAPAAHYDVGADISRHGLDGRVHVTGFVPDAALAGYLLATDIAACLRWPSNGETSASWWRVMATGRATIITELVHQADLAVIDPRGWRTFGPAGLAPIAVALPILDEMRTLIDALERLATSPRERQALGEHARRAWHEGHTLDHMADVYDALLTRATARPAPRRPLPRHLTPTGDDEVTARLAPFGLALPPGLAGG